MMIQRAVISLNAEFGNVNKETTRICMLPQVPLFINKSKIFRIMVFIIRAAGNSGEERGLLSRTAAGN